MGAYYPPVGRAGGEPLLYHLRMTRFRLAAVLGCITAAACAQGCGGSNGSGDSAGGGVIAGSTRVGWDQPADSPSQVSSLKFVMYIDTKRTALPDASCVASSSGATYPCSAVLPAMSIGSHAIEIAAYTSSGSTISEGPKSTPLTITVSGSASTAELPVLPPDGTSTGSHTSPPDGTAGSGLLVTADGARLRVDIVAALENPTAVAIGPGGQLFAGDASGRIVSFDAGSSAGAIALDTAEGTGVAVGSILDIAFDPAFAKNHFVYAIGTTAGDQPTFELARYRVVGGRLGERAVLLDNVPASPTAPAASMAFSNDGRLLLAFDDGGVRGGARRSGSYSGALLRLDSDGSTPDDQRSRSPVYAENLQSPRSLVWDTPSASAWIADAGTQQVERVQATVRGVTVTPYALPLPNGPAALALYRSSLMPSLKGSLLAAAAGEDGVLLRATFGDAAANTIVGTERLTIPGAHQIRVIKLGTDGTIYLATAAGILRIGPESDAITTR